MLQTLRQKILHKFQNDKRIKILWVTKNKGLVIVEISYKKSFQSL